MEDDSMGARPKIYKGNFRYFLYRFIFIFELIFIFNNLWKGENISKLGRTITNGTFTCKGFHICLFFPACQFLFTISVFKTLNPHRRHWKKMVSFNCAQIRGLNFWLWLRLVSSTHLDIAYTLKFKVFKLILGYIFCLLRE